MYMYCLFTVCKSLNQSQNTNNFKSLVKYTYTSLLSIETKSQMFCQRGGSFSQCG